jgi:hypothetical protein
VTLAKPCARTAGGRVLLGEGRGWSLGAAAVMIEDTQVVELRLAAHRQAPRSCRPLECTCRHVKRQCPFGWRAASRPAKGRSGSRARLILGGDDGALECRRVERRSQVRSLQRGERGGQVGDGGQGLGDAGSLERLRGRAACVWRGRGRGLVGAWHGLGPRCAHSGVLPWAAGPSGCYPSLRYQPACGTRDCKFAHQRQWR